MATQFVSESVSGKRKSGSEEAFISQAIKEGPQNFIDLELCERIGMQWYAKQMAKNKANRKKHRKSNPRVEDYWNTTWGRMVKNPESRVHGTLAYKKFRNKFRMPCDLFLDHFIPKLEEYNVFPSKYQSRIPVEIKAMIGLRILGRGNCADDISELSGVGCSTVHAIWHKFIRGIERSMFPVYVTPPTGEHMKRVLDTYARLGFPGAVGSVDCTHVAWNKCPIALKNLCKGKEKFPSLSFEVVVDHTRRIHSCTDGFIGTAADSVIVVNDPYCRAIASGLYSEVEFSLYNEDGTWTTFKGAYLICDNGYCDKWIFQKPLHNGVDMRSVYWSEFLESVRKDVECTFGILKCRFRFLAQPVNYHTASTITAAMRCACTIHNMLLAWDGNGELDWSELDAEAFDADLEEEHELVEVEAVKAKSGLSLVPRLCDVPIVEGGMDKFHQLRNALMVHFQYAFKRGCVVWPKGFTAEQRVDFPLRTRLDSNTLYTAPSFLLAKHGNSDNYNVKVGKGLFSCIGYSAGDKIAKYQGEIVTAEEYQQRIQAGHGGYGVSLQHGTVLDCYANRHECYASHANCAAGAKTRQGPDGRLAVEGALFDVQNNCKLSGSGWIVAQRNIPAHQELLVSYGLSYVYPNVMD